MPLVSRSPGAGLQAVVSCLTLGPLPKRCLHLAAKPSYYPPALNPEQKFIKEFPFLNGLILGAF